MSEWIKSKIEVRNTDVLKWYPRNVELEYHKAHALWRLSVRHDFCAPQPLKLDTARGEIVFAHLGPLRSMKDVYLEYMQASSVDRCSLDLIRASGDLLGKLHRGLKLDHTAEWTRTRMMLDGIQKAGGRNVEEFVRTCPKACLHADYGFSNVAVLKRNGETRLAVFDATPNGYSSYYTAEVGPIYVDVGLFLGALDGRVPLRHYPRMKWNRLPGVKEAFLSGYREAVDWPVEDVWAARFAYGIGHCYLRIKKRKWRPLNRVLQTLLYNRLKGNIPR